MRTRGDMTWIQDSRRYSADDENLKTLFGSDEGKESCHAERSEASASAQ